jgi:serine/threonine protein kinase
MLAPALISAFASLVMPCQVLARKNYGAKADVWSTGNIIFFLLTKQTPYTGANYIDLLQNVETKQWQLPSNTIVTKLCHDLLTRMLQKDPSRRISFEEMFEHSWLGLPPPGATMHRMAQA